MKSITTIFLGLLFTISAMSQSIDDIQFINHPYFNGNAIEKVKAKMKSIIRGLGYGGANVFFEIQGEKSKTRISQSDSLYFMINMEQGMFGSMSLFNAEQKGKKRIVMYAKSRVFSASDIGGESIQYNTIKVYENIYKIIPSEPLHPGEYSFIFYGSTSGMSADAFTFGID